MKAALIFTGSGPILVLTTFDSVQSPDFLERLAARGINRFIIHEVAPELVQKRYGARFSAVIGDLSQKDDLRVMDIDGHHVLNSFAFEEIGAPIYSPSSQKTDPQIPSEEVVETDWLWAKFDEYGNMIESSYFPMLGSRVDPSIAMDAGPQSRQARFKIDRQGRIFDASPARINGHKLVLPGKPSPALGRAGAVTPTCTWVLGSDGGWTCI